MPAGEHPVEEATGVGTRERVPVRAGVRVLQRGDGGVELGTTAAELVELAVEQDDDAMEAYLEGTEPDEATLNACIRKGTV